MTTNRYRVDAFVASGQRIASETIEADASDSALHDMAERHPRAERFRATPVRRPRSTSSVRFGRAVRTTIRDQLGVDLDAAELRDVRLMLQRADEGSLLDFFGDVTGESGGLTRDGCVAVSNLVADFGGCSGCDGTGAIADPAEAKRRGYDEPFIPCDVCQPADECSRPGCTGYKPDHDHELAF